MIRRRRYARKPHKVRTKYEKSLARTLAMRSKVPLDLRPSFDHRIYLAQDAHAQSANPGREYLARRAGLDLLSARRLAK